MSSFARRKLLGILSGTWLAQAVYAASSSACRTCWRQVPRTRPTWPRRPAPIPWPCTGCCAPWPWTGLLEQTGPGYRSRSTPPRSRCAPTYPGSVRQNVLMQGEEVFGAFAEILYSVRSGRPSFEKVHGRPFYEYLDGNPDAARVFNEAMGDQPFPPGVADRDWSGVSTVVDVGGGNGALLAEILTGRPGLRGVLLERPQALAHARERLAAAGVADRVTLAAGDFFAEVPGGGDVYLLARVLHNWTDDGAARILARVRAAMPETARLLVVEDLLPPAGGSGAAARGMVDLLMLVTQEGHDRTAAEYADLFTSAGFERVGVDETGVLEARPR